MNKKKQTVVEYLDQNKDIFSKASDKIWGFAETRFYVPKSADVLETLLKENDFLIERNIASMANAFIATYGEGAPVVGILAEYDALPQMSQVADAPEKQVLEADGNGHGCGHHILGTGAVAAAIALSKLIAKGEIKGTVKLFGCPAEESGYGKAFLARAGVFDVADVMFTWHPMDMNTIWGNSSLAVYQIFVRFEGISSHAGAAPELGRSALDAAELMNVGVQFLREHIIDLARVHYAFLDVGGKAANVVQPTAALHYFIRAPKSSQVQEIYERIVKIAEGAALMTETKVKIEWDSACSNYIPNKALSNVMYENMKQVFPVKYTDDEFEYMRHYYNQLGDDRKAALLRQVAATFPSKTPEEQAVIAKKPLCDDLCDLIYPTKPLTGSTDVGDASWIAPTAQFMVACAPHGTPPHSWQWVAVGKSSIMHKGMMAAAKVIAMTAIDAFDSPELVQKAKAEHIVNLGGETYKCAIPDNVPPS